MPTWLIVVLCTVVLIVLLLLAAGLAWNRRHRARTETELLARVAEADRALASAVAGDRGWDRARMETAASDALERAVPGLRPSSLHLVLVDDRPGTDEDRAVFEARAAGARHTVTLVRRGDDWVADTPTP